MLSLCLSSDVSSSKRKFYDSYIRNIKLLHSIILSFNSKSIVPYVIFLYGIVISSIFVHKELLTQTKQIKISLFKIISLVPPNLTSIQKIFIIIFYIIQPLSYTILLFRTFKTNKVFKSDLIYYKLENRQRYCKLCDKNVAKFDHHCAWVGSCVGAGNHFWFTIFLTSTALVNIGIGIWNYFIFQQLKLQLQFTQIWHYYASFLIQTWMCTFIGLAISPFAIMHIRNLILNQTTFERLKKELIIRQLQDCKIFISNQFEVVEVNNDTFNLEESLNIMRHRNIWNQGILGNIKESISTAFK
eukprot:EST42227.1 Zinc finger and transmembrane domain-containing protein [Spironucleus salmonicida]